MWLLQVNLITEGNVTMNHGTQYVYRTDFSALAANVNINPCDTWTPTPS